MRGAIIVLLVSALFVGVMLGGVIVGAIAALLDGLF